MATTLKTVLLLLSTDRYSFPLIRYLVLEGRRYGWKIFVGGMFEFSILDRLKEEKFSGEVGFINITDFRQCDHAIRKADLIVALVPDVMLLQIADSCIVHKKSLVAPSRLNRQMVLRKAEAEKNDTLLLMECGFSPGLDHITAKKAIDTIRIKGGSIFSFKTYSSSLVAESCIDNPWEFKLTEPAPELVNLGKQNNRHLVNDQLQHVPYHQLFARSEPVTIRGLGSMVAIPEGDSLYYRKIYQLPEASTVVKGKLMRKGFERIWDIIIKLGLTDNQSRIDLAEEKSFYHFLSSLLPYSPTDSLEQRLRKHAGAYLEDIEKLKWLGLFDDGWIDGYKEVTPAVVLQHLLEKKFALKTEDKDCIVMQHQLQYMYKGAHYNFTATLVAQGESYHDSATAKAIGLTTGAAAKAFLLGNIKVRGLHTPAKKEIYDPILNELDDLGVAFHIDERKVQEPEMSAIGNPVVLNDVR
jgi:saccharopine dehydrogenase (NADP+, L-glutamate forming)